MKRALAGLFLIAACYPGTTRPAISPLPEASRFEVALFVPETTTWLAVSLDADSIPVARTERNDGWLETDWFDAATLLPVQRRPVGPQTVKLRAWVAPGSPRHSVVTVELVYRPMVDPSLPERLLERQVPDTHPVAVRVKAVLDRMQQQYGDRN